MYPKQWNELWIWEQFGEQFMKFYIYGVLLKKFFIKVSFNVNY